MTDGEVDTDEFFADLDERPAEDEREALIDVMVMTKLSDYAATDMGTIHQAVDAILAAGYRKGPRPITDEMVKAGARALNDAGWTYEGADEPGCWCEDCQALCMPPARAILEAAEEARR